MLAPRISESYSNFDTVVIGNVHQYNTKNTEISPVKSPSRFWHTKLNNSKTLLIIFVVLNIHLKKCCKHVSFRRKFSALR